MSNSNKKTKNPNSINNKNHKITETNFYFTDEDINSFFSFTANINDPNIKHVNSSSSSKFQIKFYQEKNLLQKTCSLKNDDSEFIKNLKTMCNKLISAPIHKHVYDIHHDYQSEHYKNTINICTTICQQATGLIKKAKTFDGCKNKNNINNLNQAIKNCIKDTNEQLKKNVKNKFICKIAKGIIKIAKFICKAFLIDNRHALNQKFNKAESFYTSQLHQHKLQTGIKKITKSINNKLNNLTH